MSINLKNLCVALMLVILPPFQASADEVTDAVNDVAAELVQQLPMDKKIALKSLSPDETGLPEDFLRMLTSELAASLLKASNFQLKLMNKFTTEELWQEAIEFGDADFDALYESSQSDVMLMLSPRLSKNGLFFSVDAYRLSGDSAGTLLTSSGLTQLDIDVAKEFGINVTTLDQKIDTIIEQIGNTESRAELRAEVTYDRYEGTKKLSDTEFNWSGEDSVVATVNGKKYIVSEQVGFDLIVFRGDLDNDGFLDAVLQINLGGNAPPSYAILSYRGEGRFETFEDIATTYFEPQFLKEGFRWVIRVRNGFTADTQLEDSIEEIRLKNGKIEVKKVGALVRQFSIAKFTSEEAIDKADLNGEYMWKFDFDSDSKEEILQCKTWMRWGVVMDCYIYDEDGSWALIHSDPDYTASGGAQCKVISALEEKHEGFHKLKCDFDDLILKKSDKKIIGKNKIDTFGCAISAATSKIVNVQNFTNLRQQAGLNGRIVGRVALGETVQIVKPGHYLRYDRCAAACNGTNQTAIKQCIDNNDVWIEVQYNGRRGFLSRKFLE